MAKKKSTVYVCGECGHEERRWLGRCPSCGSWNSFREESAAAGGGPSGGAGERGSEGRRESRHPRDLARVGTESQHRLDTGIGEVNRVLGGGITAGSSVLIGGEPGIGKSTLMMQLAARLHIEETVLYVSGEESAAQLKMRADRLGIGGAKIRVVCENDLDALLTVLRREKPAVAVIDSIQTLVSQEAGAVPGTVNQLKYGCWELIDWARESGAALFLVAHVTKEGSIAGPKVIEHMVDTVLYFEQAGAGLRIIRAMKNRFGSVDEIGLFTMEEQGLVQVAEPASFFLEQREYELPPGIAAAPVYEGTRVLMVELQALVVPAKSGFSRIYSDKIDANRVSRVAAVLEKHLSLRFSDRDIYINVAGGIRLGEVGIELPLAVALYSARTGLAVPKEFAVAGEISLAGEIRPTPHMGKRVRAAREMGFSRFAGPVGTGGERLEEAMFRRVRDVGEAVKVVFGRQSGSSGG
jgi:DNA repair protein RadA/Sms